jgi:hypothetical protein
MMGSKALPSSLPTRLLRLLPGIATKGAIDADDEDSSYAIAVFTLVLVRVMGHFAGF